MFVPKFAMKGARSRVPENRSGGRKEIREFEEATVLRKAPSVL